MKHENRKRAAANEARRAAQAAKQVPLPEAVQKERARARAARFYNYNLARGYAGPPVYVTRVGT